MIYSPLCYTLHVSGDNPTHHQEYYGCLYGIRYKQVTRCAKPYCLRSVTRVNSSMVGCCTRLVARCPAVFVAKHKIHWCQTGYWYLQIQEHQKEAVQNERAIWYNKVCRQKRLIPTYINIRFEFSHKDSSTLRNQSCTSYHRTVISSNTPKAVGLCATCNLLIPEVAETAIVLMMGGIVTRNM